jgi:hypothetical protein
MNRRRFIASVGTSIAALGINSRTANAQQLSASVDPNGVLNALQLQQCPAWCWAACISTIFNYYGHPVDQKRIVADRFNGQLQCVGDPTGINVVKDLSSSWIDDNGTPFTSHITAAYHYPLGINSLTNRMIISELGNDQPLFYASTQHAMILFQATYFDSPMLPDARIFSVTVADPFAGYPKTHPLNQADMIPRHIPGGNMLMCATVRVS